MPASRRNKKKSAQEGAAQEPKGKASGLPFNPWILCLLPALFFFAFGKYLEFMQPDPYDSGAYVYSAEHLLRGACLGVDEQPSAQPGTLLVNVIGVLCLGFHETGPEIIQMILQVTALTAMFFAVCSLFGRAAGVFSVTAAAVYLSAPHIAKFGNTKEQYMIAFMVMAVSCWIFYEQSNRPRWLLLAGAALIWPYYFKATGLAVDIAFSIYFLVRGLTRGIPRKQIQRELLMLIGGAVIGLIPLAVFFMWQDQLGMLWRSFPVLVLVGVLVLDAVWIVYFYLKKIHPIRRLAVWCGQVRPAIWIIGALGIAIMLVSGALIVYSEDGDPGDVRSYVNHLFFMRICRGIVIGTAEYCRILLASAGTDSAYIAGSRQIFSLSKQAPIVLRYYGSLSLPVAASLVSIVLALGRRGLGILRRKHSAAEIQDRIVWLLAMWWVLDMAFAWISPHSYEQYYLPLCASGAMLGGYAVWRFVCSMEKSAFKIPYVFASVAVAAAMIGMAWPLVFGYKISAYSGKPYGQRQRGYVQALAQVRGGEGAWQKIGDYIREHTSETDRIYVWGWYPGIYVQAQRLAPVPKAFEGEMHTRPPHALVSQVRGMIWAFEKNPPAFIVDTRKTHFPFNRPPLELWPVLQVRRGDKAQPAFAPQDPEVLAQYEKSYKAFLTKEYGPEEAERFEAMKPFRNYVMAHYRIVPELSSLRGHVLFVRK